MRIASFGLVMVALAGSACDRRTERGFIVASGHVEATEVRLASKIAGRIETVPVDEGAVVKAGQEVARVDTTDLLLVRNQVSAERDQASADLRLREAGYRKEDKDELRAQGAALGAELDGAQRDLDRMQALLEKGSGTAKARDDAKTRRDSLAARLAATNAAIARAKSGFRGEEIDGSRARLAAVDARLAQLDQQIADASVRSPLDAVVTERLAEPGEWATSGAALAVLTDLARPWLTVYVSDPDLPNVRLGQKAEVVTDSGATRTGTVTFVAPTAEFTPKNVQTREERAKLVYKVKIGLENADGIFKPGMPAEARLAIEGGR